jgi:hypothetical protein
MDLQDNDTKTITIVETPKGNKGNKGNSRHINCQKEKKMRVETKTWGLNETDLSHITQLDILSNINNEKNKYTSLFISHIKSKICSYRQQDILKKKLDINNFVTFEEVIRLLIDSTLKCHYCSEEVFILYEKVRESKQWSLDRINNDIGHNTGNLVIACLECNLKRRRTNKDAFMFTKNMVIIKSQDTF